MPHQKGSELTTIRSWWSLFLRDRATLPWIRLKVFSIIPIRNAS